jgi:membrane protease YdiL (CAAX protease family)
VIAQQPRLSWRRGAAAGILLIAGSLAATVAGAALARLVPPDADRVPRAALASVFIAANTALAVWLCGRLVFAGRRREWGRYGISRPRRAVSSLLLFVPLAVAVLFVTAIITALLGLTGTTAVDTTHRSEGFKLFVAFLSVVLAPWTEELAIRGFLYTALAGRIGHWPSAALSAAVWSGLHLVWGVLVIFAGIGVVLAWLRRRTGSIIPGVALHGCWNAFAAGESGAGWWAAGAFGILAASIGYAVVRTGPA